MSVERLSVRRFPDREPQNDLVTFFSGLLFVPFVFFVVFKSWYVACSSSGLLFLGTTKGTKLHERNCGRSSAVCFSCLSYFVWYSSRGVWCVHRPAFFLFGNHERNEITRKELWAFFSGLFFVPFVVCRVASHRPLRWRGVTS